VNPFQEDSLSALEAITAAQRLAPLAFYATMAMRDRGALLALSVGLADLSIQLDTARAHLQTAVRQPAGWHPLDTLVECVAAQAEETVP
jgi:hypothetical protein